MSSKRGAKNIERFNQARMSRNLRLIQDALARYRKRKLSFESFGALCQDLSRSVGIHRTTLGRNTEYRSQLLAYLGTQSSFGFKRLKSHDSENEFNAALLLKEVEVANLRNRVQSLQAYIQRAGLPPQTDPARGSNPPNADYQKFADTAMALSAVLERFREILKLDASKGMIEDLSAPPSRRIVVDGKRLAAYIAWREQQTSPQSSGSSSHLILS